MHLINVIYDHTEVFSLFDGDLGFCNILKHSIPTTTDKHAISVRDSFPLPCVEEALQVVQAAVWFSSFDLAQGYLQMAMEEEDIEKTAFRAGSSGLYEFTCMPFGLTSVGASFCTLIEKCIGDQQYITLLFYLDNICIFTETADQMLDRIELVFSRLKEFNLKIKPKKSHLFQTSVTFLGHILSADGVSPTGKKSQKSRIGLFQKHLKRLICWACLVLL